VRNTKNKRPSPQERAQQRADDRDYARQAVEQLRSTEAWKRWLATRASFHSYSLANQLLIAMQHPTATRVAGFRAWLKLGYCVQKGEKAIRIWAPCPPTHKQLEKWRTSGQQPQDRPRTFFKLTAVFDTLSRVWPSWRQKSPVSGYSVILMLLLSGWSGGVGGIRGRRGAGARRAAA